MKGDLVSNVELRRAEQFLLGLLDRHGRAIAPGELLQTAAREPNRPLAEHLRIALWNLLASKVITRTDDNTLVRSGQDTVRAARVGTAATR